MANRVLPRSSPVRRTFSLAGLFSRTCQPTSINKTPSKGKSHSHRRLRSYSSRLAKRRYPTTKGRLTSACAKPHARAVRHAIVQEFKSSIRDTREQIAEDVANTLAVTEQDATRGIEEANMTYSGKLDHYQTTRRALLGDFHPTIQHPKEMKYRSPALADRLNMLRDALDQKQAALDVHWKEWVNVQQKIFHLGIETLGPEVMSDAPHNGSCKRKLHAAVSASKTQLDVEGRMQETRRKQGADAENLTIDARKKLGEQEKAWLSEKRSRREQMLQLAKQMMACA